jgi:hypothetical protein
MQINSGPARPAQAAAMRGIRIPVLLALFAMSALLLVPVCDALEPMPSLAGQQAPLASQDPHDPAGCCDALSAGDALVPAAALVAFAADEAGTVFGPPALRQELRPSTRAATGPPRLPPRSLRYHARTARILA